MLFCINVTLVIGKKNNIFSPQVISDCLSCCLFAKCCKLTKRTTESSLPALFNLNKPIDFSSRFFIQSKKFDFSLIFKFFFFNKKKILPFLRCFFDKPQCTRALCRVFFEYNISSQCFILLFFITNWQSDVFVVHQR